MLRDADSGQIDHMAAEPTHGPHHPCTSSSRLGARGTLLAIGNVQLHGGSTGVGRNIRRDLIKTPSRRHFESKRTSKTGSTSKIGSRNGFVRFGKFCIVRSLSPYGVLNSGHKLTVTYYGEITIEPILNPEFDVDHDFEVKNGCFQSLFPRFRVISVYSTGRASHSDHFSGQVSMATILQDFYLFRRGFQLGTRDHLPDEG